MERPPRAPIIFLTMRPTVPRRQMTINLRPAEFDALNGAAAEAGMTRAAYTAAYTAAVIRAAIERPCDSGGEISAAI